MTLRILDSRIRQEHVAKYGLTDDIEGYLRVLENIPAVPDDKDGENHHMLAQSTFPEYANLAANAWNRLRVHRGVHLALTELQARFEDKLRLALNLARGLSAEAYLDACKRGGAAAGRKAVESGKLAKARTLESCRKGGLRVHELHPDFCQQNWKTSV